MPSKSLAVLPSTPSPTALFARTAHSWQILTPAFSLTSALLSRSLRGLLHSFLPRANSARGAEVAQTCETVRCSSSIFSMLCALLLHSFAVRGKSSRLFPTACALFAKKTGVYPSRSLRVSTIQLLTALDSILTEAPSCKPFRMNTYRKQG